MRAERACGDAVQARMHVVVHRGQQRLERGGAESFERGDHLRLARQAVRDQAAHLLVRLADQVAMTGCEYGDILAEQCFERAQVGLSYNFV